MSFEKVSVTEKLCTCVKILKRFGHDCNVSEKELMTYLTADTPYPDLSSKAILSDDLWLIHELIEINELKKMGIAITGKDLIMKNLEKVYEAHLKALKLELLIAQKLGRLDHIERSFKNLKNIVHNDPLIPSHLRSAFKDMLEKYRSALEGAKK